MISYDPAVRH